MPAWQQAGGVWHVTRHNTMSLGCLLLQGAGRPGRVTSHQVWGMVTRPALIRGQSFLFPLLSLATTKPRAQPVTGRMCVDYLLTHTGDGSLGIMGNASHYLGGWGEPQSSNTG